ncbi:MAG: hypothetical protein KF831_06280 [Acidobacteria bacterium]|nr:hypothetical protein [Acidobacteriota bacterium]HCA57772.1 hypothetical protein [Blastocatellia bacterium]
MRVIASVQSKRGSSRGLIHYIAHSKIDTEREHEKGRELFNAFADELSVKSANNSIKPVVGRGRPSNEDLHHLVLSFRPDDYRALGSTEKQRRAALKDTTRAAMARLETLLNADRVSWAASVHLNTKNPHVHIAIQKEFLNKDLETRSMTKIPRESLPYFELRDGEKVLTSGGLIDAAIEKMEQLMVRDRERELTRRARQSRKESGSLTRDKTDLEKGEGIHQEAKEEREILRRGILAEYELQRIESKLKILTEHGDRMRFLVADPVSGQKRRLSLHDLEQSSVSSNLEPNTSPERQIRTILLKMRAHEEAAKDSLKKAATDAIREAVGIKKLYKKSGWKLPTPSLTKDDLDKLQKHCLEHSNARRFSYLESIRTELENKQEVEPRSNEDFSRLAAEKAVSEMRERLLAKNYADLNDRQYISVVNVGQRKVSLAQLDREEATSKSAVVVFARKLKDTALRLAGKGQGSTVSNENDRLRHDIVSKLNGQLSGVRENQRNEGNKAKIIGTILAANCEGKTPSEPIYSTDQLAEIDTLSLRLKLEEHYDKNWNEQLTLIASAGNDSRAYRKLLKVNPTADFTDHKNKIIAGRAIAREIASRVELDKAKEELRTFTRSKHFQKVAIADKATGDVAFLSLHDVDPPRRNSLLDRALDQVFESREHRAIRRTIKSLVEGREQRLNDEVSAAKGIVDSAALNASEFKQSSLFGLRNEPVAKPIFTSSEITAIEKRAFGTRDASEAVRLQKVLASAAEQPAGSLTDILRDFENPGPTSTQNKERDTALQKIANQQAAVVSENPARVSVGADRVKEPSLYGHSR